MSYVDRSRLYRWVAQDIVDEEYLMAGADEAFWLIDTSRRRNLIETVVDARAINPYFARLVGDPDTPSAFYQLLENLEPESLPGALRGQPLPSPGRPRDPALADQLDNAYVHHALGPWIVFPVPSWAGSISAAPEQTDGIGDLPDQTLFESILNSAMGGPIRLFVGGPPSLIAQIDYTQDWREWALPQIAAQAVQLSPPYLTLFRRAVAAARNLTPGERVVLQTLITEYFEYGVPEELPPEPAPIAGRPGHQLSLNVNAWVNEHLPVPSRHEGWQTEVAGGLGTALFTGGIATLSRWLAVAAPVSGSMGQTVNEAIEGGASDEEIGRLVALAGVAGLATPALARSMGMSRFLQTGTRQYGSRTVERISRLGAEAVVGGAEETIQSFVERVIENLGVRSTYDPSRGVFEGAFEAALTGGIVGSVVGAGASIFRAIPPDPTTIALRTQSALDGIDTALRRGGTEPADLELHRAALNDLIADGSAASVYIPTDQFTAQLEAAGIDPVSVASEIPGVGQEGLQTATSTGAGLAIPVDGFLTHIAGTERYPVLRDHMYIHPEHLTAAQAGRSLEPLGAEIRRQAQQVKQDLSQAEGDFAEEISRLQDLDRNLRNLPLTLDVASRRNTLRWAQGQLFGAVPGPNLIGGLILPFGRSSDPPLILPYEFRAAPIPDLIEAVGLIRQREGIRPDQLQVIDFGDPLVIGGRQFRPNPSDPRYQALRDLILHITDREAGAPIADDAIVAEIIVQSPDFDVHALIPDAHLSAIVQAHSDRYGEHPSERRAVQMYLHAWETYLGEPGRLQ